MHSPPLWTAEQLAVLDALELSDDPLSVESCAGSGKSTVLLECAHRLAARHEPVRVAAFGREATAKLKARLAPLLATHRRFVEVRSIYGAGFVALDDHFGGSRESRAARMREEQGGGPEAPPARVSIKPGQTPAQALAATRGSAPELGWTFDADATKQRCLTVAERVTSKPAKLAESLHEIADAAKNTLVDPTDLAGLGRVVWGLALARNEVDAARLAGLASEVLQATLAEPRRGDYRDMGWLAVMLDVIPVFPGTVLLDEAQDLNPLEHEIVRRMCGGSGGSTQPGSAPRAGARLVQFGDPTQAIFGWNGAVPDGMRRLATSVDAVRMQLSVSFRCPLRVTQEANVFNPSMQSDPSCGLGDVRKNVGIPQMLREIEPGAV
ncbi:MAG: UvrD-helicase domain-containing protein, partial [Myxococcales bacterium]|nr:UvrD-helicase domain-containing protein [Myxococcales bacterium]